jgi:hypothetical protein
MAWLNSAIERLTFYTVMMSFVVVPVVGMTIIIALLVRRLVARGIAAVIVIGALMPGAAVLRGLYLAWPWPWREADVIQMDGFPPGPWLIDGGLCSLPFCLSVAVLLLKQRAGRARATPPDRP